MSEFNLKSWVVNYINSLNFAVTDSIAANKAVVKELTVDEIDTSDKVNNYLNSDISPVKYIRIFDQTMQFILATTDGTATEQARDRSGNPLYWEDQTHKRTITRNTPYPVMIFVYTETVQGSVYFDTVKNSFVFDGELSADVIEALSAVITPTIIVNNLYAQYGRIANLSVSELDTSWQKISNYLDGNTSDVRYQRIYEDRKETIIARVSGLSNASSFYATAESDSQINLTWVKPTSFGVEQLKDKDDNNLYWTDETYSALTTTETAYPAYTYAYDEITKLVDGTEPIDGAYSPYTLEGAGDGQTANSGKVKRQKKTDGYYITYYKRNTGDSVETIWTDDGFSDNNVGTTAERPTAPPTGFRWFDTTLGIPIWYNGSNWIDATGTTV